MAQPDIRKITLKQMITKPEYYGLADGFAQLIPEQYLRIGRRYYLLPETADQFAEQICYGQRLYFGQNADNDFDVIIRMICGYFYLLITGRIWNADCVLSISKIVISCRAIQIYPAAMHLVTLFGELAEREINLLNRKPTKLELAAGIDNLNRYSDLMTLDFLRDSMKITIEEVLQTPYNEILVRLMMAKEVDQYRERYIELLNKQNEPKSKYQKTES